MQKRLAKPPKATSKRTQSHLQAKAESRKQKAKRRGNAAQSQVHAWYMGGKSQVKAMCLGGDREVKARYMRGACEVHGRYMHGTSRHKATQGRMQNDE